MDSLALTWTTRDVDRENATLMARQQIIDEIADDRVRLVPEFRDHPANQRAAATVPFEVDRAVQISRAVNLGPAMRTSRLLGPNFLELEFSFELRIAHDLAAQRSPSCRDHLDHGLHSVVRFNCTAIFAIILLASRESR